MRHYLHVVDFVLRELAALEVLARRTSVLTVNLGAGRDYSVLEVVRALAAASDRSVPYRIVSRWPGDVAQCYADPSHAREAPGGRRCGA